MSEQSFQFSEGTSNKFWKINLNGSSFTVNFGRIGTSGQLQTKDFPSEQDAKREHDKLIAEKLKKGYIAVHSAATSAATSTATSTATATSTSAPPPAVAAPPKSHHNISPAPTKTTSPPLVSSPAASTQTAVMEKPIIQTSDSLSPGSCHVNFTLPEWSFVFWKRKDLGTQSDKLSILNVEKTIDTVLKTWSDLSGDPYSTWKFSSAFVSLLTWLQQQNAKSELSDSAAAAVDVLTPAGFIDLWCDEWAVDPAPLVLTLFRALVVGLCTDEQLEMFRAHVRERMKVSSWDEATLGTLCPHLYVAAAALGMQDELLPVIESWPDGAYRNNWNFSKKHPQRIIFGLRDSNLVDHHMRRLSCTLRDLEDTYCWIAHTEDRGLDLVEKQILAVAHAYEAEKDKQQINQYISIVAKVESAQTAKCLFDLFVSCKHGKDQIRAWMEQFPYYAAIGLSQIKSESFRNREVNKTPILGVTPSNAGALDNLLKERGRMSDPFDHAKTLLRDLVKSKKLDLDSLDQKTIEKLRALDLLSSSQEASAPVLAPPDWLVAALAMTQKGKRTAQLPAFLESADFSPVLQWDLSTQQVHTILSACKQSTPDNLHPILLEIRRHAPSGLFDVFVWDVFTRWQSAGAPQKERWCIWSVGMLGSQEVVFQLLPWMYRWRESGNHHQAFWGLDCFLALGSDVALMKVHEISQNQKLKSLRAKALELIVKIAQSRGLSKEQLEDRIVPSCGLDENGARVFDFGSRKFFFVMGAGLKPSVRDEDNKVKPDLPEPTQRDNLELAKQEIAQWKELKKNIKTVAKVQATKLEQALVTGRRWTFSEFEMYLLKHPLMCHLVRPLVWAGYDSEGKMVKTFRVAEDNQCSDEYDKNTEIAGLHEIGLVHPLNCPLDLLGRWGELLTDYEIVPPFPQLGRATFALTSEEKDKSSIDRFNEFSIPAIAVPSTLERLGWSRGLPISHGYYHCHSKQFYGANLTVAVEYDDGIQMQMALESEPQHLSGCFFLSGIHKPAESFDLRAAIPLKDVDPVVLSEVLSDLSLLTSKAKTD